MFLSANRRPLRRNMRWRLTLAWRGRSIGAKRRKAIGETSTAFATSARSPLPLQN